MVKWVVPVFSAAACGFPHPADVPGDATEAAQLVVRVSTAGNDGNDGLTSPVLTLKRALAIAAAHLETVTIAMEAGRYGMPGTESFPYTVPSNVTVSGAMTGATILGGDSTTPGLTIDGATIRDLELEAFTTALTASNMAVIRNVHIRSSDRALRVTAGATATVNALDIAGTPGACATGLVLEGNAVIAATGVATHALGASMLMNDNSMTKLTNATFMGDTSCSTAVVQASSGSSFAVNDGVLDGGTTGMSFMEALAPTQTTLTNVTIRNMKLDGIAGDTVSMHMTGGEISNNGFNDINASGGTWVLTNVAFQMNNASGVLVQHASLTMRGCMLASNGNGVHVVSGTKTDLGNDLASGNNTLQNKAVGIILDGGTQVTAVGDMWQPNKQGADSAGKYSSNAIVNGPVPLTQGNNYTILDQSTLEL